MRVAVILPQPYRGGTLRAGREVALMLKTGRGTPLDVVFAVAGGAIDMPMQRELGAHGISVRPFTWESVDGADAKRMAAIAQPPIPLTPRHARYAVPRDGVADLGDCDFWLFLSDRVPHPMFPRRPYGVVVFDCLQRYVPSIMTDAAWAAQATTLIPFVREAAVVLVTTPTTGIDVQTFVGVSRERIRLAPLTFTAPVVDARTVPASAPYILWATNRSMHKNHAMVLRGLQRYYEYGGDTLDTIILGVETEYLRPDQEYPYAVVEDYLKPLRRSLREIGALREHVTIAGEVSDTVYRRTLAGARVLLHSSLYDNGTFAAFDAAALGIPTLSARYPAMEYLDRTYALDVQWFDARDPDDLAARLRAFHAPAGRIGAGAERFAALDWTRNADTFRDLLQPWLTSTI